MTWQRTLWLMVAIQATIAFARSAAYPFLPFFLIEIGVRPISSVVLWAGAAISIQFFMAALFAPLWGTVADRIGRKAMVVRATAAIGVSTALMVLTNQAWEVFALRAIAGSVSGFSSTALALVGTQVPEERLGFALGWMATAELMGNLIGPLFGGLLADRLHDYRAIFLMTSVLALATSLACALFIHEPAAPQAPRKRIREPFWRQLSEIARHPSLAPMFMVLLVAQLCVMGVEPIVPVFVATLVHGSWVSTATGMAIAITAIGDVIASPWLGKRSDRIGYRRVLLISLAGAALFTLPQGLARSVWIFIALRFGVGVFLGGILPTANAWIGRMTPPERRGQVYGGMSSAAFLGMAVGPILGATVAAHFGFVAVFALMGTLMLANLVWLARAVRLHPRLGETAMEVPPTTS